jgi:putative transposase
MLRTFKYRIYPNKEQKTKIDKTLYLCRTLYNLALEQRIFAYTTQRKNMRKFDQCNELIGLKEEFPIFSEVYSQVLQNTLDRLDKAFQNFFRRIKTKEKPGFPRFKSQDRFNSFLFPQYKKLVIAKNKIHLSKIGDVKITYHRQVEGITKTLSVIKETDSYYISITCEIEKKQKKKVSISRDKIVGIDLGLTSFAVLSNNEVIANPRHLNKSSSKLKRQQRYLSRRKLHSTNRKRQRRIVAKIHNKIKNQRKDFLHKLSKDLVSRFDLIAFEDLNIKQLLSKGVKNINRGISDVAWRQFINYCTYKAEDAGKHLILVDARNTTKECSECHCMMKLPLWMREYNCPNCGLRISRDLNASYNIRNRGINQYCRNYSNSRLGNLFDRTDYDPRSSLRLRDE